tara:strand:+ start:1237 stop:1866 length:630 start_codon:yes stop_codon:yes gene_type:complete
MTKVISFSLWGKNPKYTIGAIRNAELAKEIYPDWVCRFYTGEDVTNEIKSQLLDLKSEVIEMDGADWNGMFWRFLAAEDADIMISRDTDSRLGEREKAAVDEWLVSDKDFHIMRDHPHHRIEILGGMWGCRNEILKGIKGMIQDYDTREYHNKYQVDQNFLREIVWPLVRSKVFVHDPYFSTGHEFPTMREDIHDFVGQVFDENEVPQF